MEDFVLKTLVGRIGSKDQEGRMKITTAHNVITNSTDLPKDKWIVDSGCTISTTYDKAWFVEIFPFTASITVGNGAVVPIKGVGDVALHVDMVFSRHYDPVQPSSQGVLHLAKVFWCPDLHFNLLSVSQGLRQGLNFEFPRVDLCRISLVSQDAYVLAPHDLRTALFTLRATPAPLSPKMALMGASLTEKFIAFQDQYLKEFKRWTEDPHVNVAKGGVLHPFYVQPPHEFQGAPSASYLFHPWIVERGHPILSSVCMAIAKLTSFSHPMFRLNTRVCALIGEARLTNGAVTRLWHRRLGHPGSSVLKDLIKLNPSLYHLRGRRLPDLKCSSCEYAKSKRQPFRSSAVFRATYPGQRIVSDIWGPFRVPTIGSARYFVIFVDDYSRYTWLYTMTTRKDLIKSFENFRTDFKQLFRKEMDSLSHSPSDDIEMLHMDNAQEYISLRNHLRREGIPTRCHFSMAYSPSQNGIAERRIGLIVLKMRSLLFEGDLPKILWGEAALYAVWLINITPCSSNDGRSPHFRIMNQEPDLSLVRTFGCTAFAHIHAPAREDKLDPRSKKLMFVGISSHRYGWKLLDPFSHHLIESRDVIFWESEFPAINTVDAAAAYRKAMRDRPLGYVPMLHPNAPLPPIDSLLRSMDYRGRTSSNFTSLCAVESHLCPPTVDDDLDILENHALLHTFHDFTSSTVKAQPFLSFDDYGFPFTQYRKYTRRVTFQAYTESVQYFHEDSVDSLLKGTANVRAHDISGLASIPANDSFLPTDITPLIDVRRVGSTLVPSFACLARAMANVSQPSLHLREALSDICRRVWRPLPRPATDATRLAASESPVLLHLLTEDPPHHDYAWEDEYGSDNPADRELYSLLATKISSHPKSWAQAMRRHDAAQWRAACQSEMKSLEETQTWDLVPYSDIPKGRRALPVRWVFTIKTDGRYKARLVVLGCLQTTADYDDIFAPVIRLECLRSLFTLACHMGYEIHAMDVKTAFLNAAIDTDIWVAQPPGFAQPGRERDVCKLRRSLYGLKQSPKLWYETFVSYMTDLGFQRLRKDRCVFLRRDTTHSIFLGLYVDDIIIVAPDSSKVGLIKQALHQRFHMTDLGPLKAILGWEIERNPSVGSMFIHQQRYAEEVVKKFGNNVPTYSTPMEPHVKLSKHQSPSDDVGKAKMQTFPYRSLVGSLMYLAMGTRPDLVFAVQQLSQFLTNPGKAHWDAAQRVIGYLAGTKSLGLVLGGPNSHSKPILSAYVDADYAHCSDTRRCISGYVTLLYGTLISWLSKKQPLVTLSTTEAEYVALALCLQELLYLKHLFIELGLEFSEAIPVYEDNQSCIKVASNPELHARTKHIDVRYFFVKDLVADGIFDLVYCKSADMWGDFFTKALPKASFIEFRSAFNMRLLETYHRGDV